MLRSYTSALPLRITESRFVPAAGDVRTISVELIVWEPVSCVLDDL
jgi:hypothetical protein